MKKTLFILSTALLCACGNPDKTTETTVGKIVEIPKIETTTHGETITEEGAISSEEFLTQFNGMDSMEVKLSCAINDVCAKKGCWMVLDLGNDQTMRVTFKDYGFFVPKDASGKLATIQGVAKIDTTDVATLKHYAEDAAASQEEIDAITEPEINYSFEAVGVIIKEKEVGEE